MFTTSVFIRICLTNGALLRKIYLSALPWPGHIRNVFIVIIFVYFQFRKTCKVHSVIWASLLNQINHVSASMCISSGWNNQPRVQNQNI